MKTAAIGVASSAVHSGLAVFGHVGQYADLARAGCAAARRRLRYRKIALLQRLEELALEMLAAIVVILIFVVMTDPAPSEDC